MAAPLLPFAQLDFVGELALADGRYLVRPPGRPEANPDVLGLRTLGASRAHSRLRRGKPVPLDREPDAPPLPLSRLTLVKAIPFEDPAAAADWLERIAAEDELAAGLTEEVAQTLNRALLAHRVSAPDPYAADVSADEVLAVRFGFGSGQEVSEGRWEMAYELPEARRQSLRRKVMDGVGAQERVAAVLGGRDEVSPPESMLVDAERAAEEGRLELAAVTAAAALDALARSGGDAGEARPAIDTLRKRALGGAEVDAAELRKALRGARRAIRAQR